MKSSGWGLWAPLAVIALGLYRLVIGDPILSVVSISVGVVLLGAGLIGRYRRS